MSPRSAPLACAAIALLAASPAGATQGEHEASAALVVGGGPVLGADAQWLYHASDFWAFGATARPRWSVGAAGAIAADVTARYTVDALTWIPSVALGAGGGWWSDHGGVTPALRAELSLAWRPARSWAIVARADAETDPASPPTSPRWLFGVGYVRYFGRGIGVDL